MSDRKLDIIVVGTALAVLLAALIAGCRALNNDWSLWL